MAVDDVILRSISNRPEVNPFEVPDSDSNDNPDPNVFDEMVHPRHSTSSSSGDHKAKAPRECLGKLVYKHDDINSIKCLVAARMTKKFVESEVAPAAKGKGGGARTCFTLADGSGKLTDPFAISWFLSCYDVKASKTPDKFGALMMQWQSFSSSELKPHLSGLLREGNNKRRDVMAGNNKRKIKLLSALDTLNEKLMEARFLVANKMTLADVVLAVDLLPLFDKAWSPEGGHNVYLKDILSKDYKYIREWFRIVKSRSIFHKAVGQFRTNMLKEADSASLDSKTADAKGDAVDGNTATKAKAKAKGSTGKYKVSATASQNGVASDKVDMSGLSKRPLKILCIHGYRQNDISFKEKLGAFRKLVGKYCEFTFIRAPHPVLPMCNEDINQDQRGWWFSRENDYFKADDASDCDKGFDSSVALIERTFDMHGPFDGMLGFSQGASLISLLCLMKERGELSPVVNFKFAIMVASFKSLSTKHQKWYGDDAKKVTMPTLHVFGNTDNVIKKPKSEELMALFENASQMVHPGGHYVPAKAQQKTGYFSFLHKASLLREPEIKDETETPSGDNAAVVEPSAADESNKPQVNGDSLSDEDKEVADKKPKTGEQDEPTEIAVIVPDENQNSKPAAIPVDHPDAQPINA